MSTMAFDLGQKLNDEIKLTQELDNRLIGALKKNSKSKNSTTTNDQNGVISNKLKVMLIICFIFEYINFFFSQK